MPVLLYQLLSQFQSTPPRRRRLITGESISDDKKFQSTPPRRRRQEALLKLKSYQDFNPRLREGGDSLSVIFSVIVTISIHASEKEATGGTTCLTPAR